LKGGFPCIDIARQKKQKARCHGVKTKRLKVVKNREPSQKKVKIIKAKKNRGEETARKFQTRKNVNNGPENEEIWGEGLLISTLKAKTAGKNCINLRRIKFGSPPLYKPEKSPM